MSDALFLVAIALVLTAIVIIPPLLMGVLDVCVQASGLVVALFTFMGAMLGLIVGVPSKKDRRGKDERHDDDRRP